MIQFITVFGAGQSSQFAVIKSGKLHSMAIGVRSINYTLLTSFLYIFYQRLSMSNHFIIILTFLRLHTFNYIISSTNPFIITLFRKP